MIRDYAAADFEHVLAVVNDAAEVYRGVIPADRWHEPYMPAEELRAEIGAGVSFRLWLDGGDIVGVMGGQAVKDVFLIRHAYVLTARQGQGIGGRLLSDQRARSDVPVLIGTWAAARWAVRFYEGRGFRRVSPAEKDRLLRIYWTVPERQIEESVVLADARWFARAAGPAVR